MTENFNPRTPDGVRRDVDFEYIKTILISIHAPLTGCDATLTLIISKRF